MRTVGILLVTRGRVTLGRGIVVIASTVLYCTISLRLKEYSRADGMKQSRTEWSSPGRNRAVPDGIEQSRTDKGVSV